MFDQFCLPLGFKTGIFTNNWVDDSSGRLFTATLLGALRRHFDVVIESCRAGLHKPDPRLYAHALEVLQAKPQDVRAPTVSQGHPKTPRDTQGHQGAPLAPKALGRCLGCRSRAPWRAPWRAPRAQGRGVGEGRGTQGCPQQQLLALLLL